MAALSNILNLPPPGPAVANPGAAKPPAAKPPAAAVVEAPSACEDPEARKALERALDDTLSMDGAARRAAQSYLEALALTPATFAPLLLRLVRDTDSYQRSLSAALALKNVVKKRWDDSSSSGGSGGSSGSGGGASPKSPEDSEVSSPEFPVQTFGSDPAVKASLRRDILAALLESGANSSKPNGAGGGEVSKVLAETFRTIAAADFPSKWPELLPTLSAALRSCDSPATTSAPPSSSSSSSSAVRLEQCLLAVAMLSKQFVYFRDHASKADGAKPSPGSSPAATPPPPSSASSASSSTTTTTTTTTTEGAAKDDSVPLELEQLASQVVLPLLTGTLPALEAAMQSGGSSGGRCLQSAYLICKIAHRCTRAYMPSALHEVLGGPGGATATLLSLLSTALRRASGSGNGGNGNGGGGGVELEARLAKRALQVLNTLQIRHETTVQAHLPALLEVVWGCLEPPAADDADGGGAGDASSSSSSSSSCAPPDLLAALCLDVIAASSDVLPLRRGVFERCVASLHTVLLPRLRLGKSDRELWCDDPDEFVGRNLELDLEGVVEAASSKVGDGELTSARKSTIALLEAMIRDDDERRLAKQAAAGKGAKGGGKTGRKAAKGSKRGKAAAAAAAAGGGGDVSFCAQVMESLRSELAVTLATLKENAPLVPSASSSSSSSTPSSAASKKGHKEAGALLKKKAGKKRDAAARKAKAALEIASGDLCGLLLGLGVMAPWLKANGKGKELANLCRSLVLPACDPTGFDAAAAAAGKPPAAAAVTAMTTTSAIGKQQALPVTPGDGKAGSGSGLSSSSSCWVGNNKYVCAHALWCVYKAGSYSALPEALNASILDLTLACMARKDDDDDDDDDDDGTVNTDASSLDVSAELSMEDSLSASPGGGGGNDDDDDDDDDDEEEEESCSWKPVRVAAAYALYQLIQNRYPREQLRLVLQRLVDAMIGCAKDEQQDEDAAGCNGLPMRVCHLVAETAEEDLLPHMAPMSRVLARQCVTQLEDGEDMSESVALEALGMLAATLIGLWEGENADDDDDDDDDADADDDDDDDDDEDGQAGGAKKARQKADKKKKKQAAAMATTTAFSFGPDKKSIMTDVTAEVVLIAMPVLSRIWSHGGSGGATAFSEQGSEAGGGGGGPIFLADAAVLLKLVLFHGAATVATSEPKSKSAADESLLSAADDDDDDEVEEVWTAATSASLRVCVRHFLGMMAGWVGTCELDYADEAWEIAAHAAARPDVLPTAPLDTCKEEARECRRALLSLAGRAFAEGDLKAVRFASLALRRAMAAASSRSHVATATNQLPSESSSSSSSSSSSCSSSPELALSSCGWPAPAAARAAEVCSGAILSMRQRADDEAEAKLAAIWLVLAACVSSSVGNVDGGGSGAAAERAALSAVKAFDAVASAGKHAGKGSAGGGGSGGSGENEMGGVGGGSKHVATSIQLCQALAETLRSVTTLREDQTHTDGGGKHDDDEEEDEEDEESAVEIGLTLSEGSRKSLVIAVARIVQTFSDKDCTAALRRQLGAVLESAFPLLVQLKEEKDEDARVAAACNEDEDEEDEEEEEEEDEEEEDEEEEEEDEDNDDDEEDDDDNDDDDDEDEEEEEEGADWDLEEDVADATLVPAAAGYPLGSLATGAVLGAAWRRVDALGFFGHWCGAHAEVLEGMAKRGQPSFAARVKPLVQA